LRTQHSNPDRVALAPRARSTKAAAVDVGALVGGARLRPAEPLGPGGVLKLQRSAGNAAVARLLVGQRSPVAVQRSKESAALLTKLATPKVGEGQATGVQTELVDGLEKLIMAKDWRTTWNPEGEAPADLTLGGVLIDRLPDADNAYMPSEDKQQREGDIQGLFEDLALGGRNPFAPAVFVGLGNVKDDKAAKLSAKLGTEVKQAGLGPKVVENTLKTMLDAGQFEYLRLAGLPNDEWKILVEVHYVRARPKDMAGFHKDTQGESLFVNLNYHVPGARLRGPEYVLNPPKSAQHDELIGTPEKRGTLPEEFINDLIKIRVALGEPTRIESAGTVEGLGYVAFVDEAIHHATPWFGGRYVTPSEFKAYLERQVKADKEYQAWRNRKTTKGGYSQLPSDDKSGDLASFSKYVNGRKKVKVDHTTKGGYSKFEHEHGDSASFSKFVDKKKWKKWLAMASVEESKNEERERVTRYTREDFAGTMHGIEFDLMLEDVGSHHTDSDDRRKGGAAGWYAASIPGSDLSPIKPQNKPPLERTASQPDVTKNWPKQLPEDVPRKFIRSWVRAVPKSFADSVRGS
jgi:hypothetical protein